jgi:hypothetical protein
MRRIPTTVASSAQVRATPVTADVRLAVLVQPQPEVEDPTELEQPETRCDVPVKLDTASVTFPSTISRIQKTPGVGVAAAARMVVMLALTRRIAGREGDGRRGGIASAARIGRTATTGSAVRNEVGVTIVKIATIVTVVVRTVAGVTLATTSEMVQIGSEARAAVNATIGRAVVAMPARSKLGPRFGARRKGHEIRTRPEPGMAAGGTRIGTGTRVGTGTRRLHLSLRPIPSA